MSKGGTGSSVSASDNVGNRLHMHDWLQHYLPLAPAGRRSHWLTLLYNN